MKQKSLLWHEATDLLNRSSNLLGLIAGGERIIPFDRDGEKPVLTQLSNHTELHQSITAKVAELQSLGNHSIAIICKSSQESFEAYEALSSIDNIKLLKVGSTEYEQGVVVIPSYLAKGIEFDAVIIYDASDQVYGDESLADYSTPLVQEPCISCNFTV